VIPNLHNVTPDFWRGGRVGSSNDWEQLYIDGCRRVLVLNGDSDAYARALGLEVIQCPITDDEAQSALRDPTVLDRIDAIIDARRPLFVHCTEGMDRTGIAVARYRVRQCGWTKADAFAEWVKFGSHGYKGLVDNWNAWTP
jgi:hypothetical protein